MPGHITLPFIWKKGYNGYSPPGNLSHELLTGLLEKEMHLPKVSDAAINGRFPGWYKNDLEGVASFLGRGRYIAGLLSEYAWMACRSTIQRGEI